MEPIGRVPRVIFHRSLPKLFADAVVAGGGEAAVLLLELLELRCSSFALTSPRLRASLTTLWTASGIFSGDVSSEEAIGTFD